MTMTAINIRKLKLRKLNGYNINAGGENLNVSHFPTMKPLDNKNEAEQRIADSES